MHFTVEEENLIYLYHNADRRRTMGKITAALPDMDGDMRVLAQQTLSKLERMTDTDYDNQKFNCNGVQREHNKKLNNGLPILHKVPPKRDYGRYFCIMAEKGGTSHGGLTEKLSLFFHAKKQEVNAYGR